ncbi:hypothetical protein C8J57DRAFT_1009578, partial [Mycena rebaudengoi]
DSRKFQEAHRKDQESIVKHLQWTLASESTKEAVLVLDVDSAQYLMNLIQNVAFDQGFLMEREYHNKARKLLFKLSKASDGTLPSSLFISGVNNRDDNPIFGGSFGDIYRATY